MTSCSGGDIDRDSYSWPAHEAYPIPEKVCLLLVSALSIVASLKHHCLPFQALQRHGMNYWNDLILFWPLAGNLGAEA
jgi:hypothetical protein